MKKILFLLIAGFSLNLFAQELSPSNLTGILSIDSKVTVRNSEIIPEIIKSEVFKNKKSPLLAGAMSFIIPGSGEIYTENYLKAALFLAAEATLIYLKYDYDKKGDDQTDLFESYAHENWSVAKYAEWSMKRFGLYDEWKDKVFDSSKPHGVDWSQLNALEDYISRTGEGKYYSHHLAPFSDQQYYEMIGKYIQFAAGWKDFNDPNFLFRYGDDITEMFRYYKGERGKANDYYNTASTMMSILIVNHIMSGIDAILSANSYNKQFEIKATVGNRNLGLRNVYYPELNLRFSL